jgi:FKBP-type peptidyl-prolyl cis-trans isomerase FklB
MIFIQPIQPAAHCLRIRNPMITPLRRTVRLLPSLLFILTVASRAHAGTPAAAAGHGKEGQGKEQASYSLGLSFATQWREGGLDGLLSEADLIRGIRAGLAGTALTADDRQRANTFMRDAYDAWSARNQAAAAEFLAHNAKQPGVKTTASGLQYSILAKGDPKAPMAGVNDRVKVQYTGRLLNGREFDSTAAHGQPAIVRPSTLIAGWSEALQMMQTGAKWQLFVPPELAYGKTPPPSIPPNSLLIFDLEVLAIDQAGAPPAAAR